MSAEEGVVKRPSLWSYASFTTRPRRRSSVRLPTREVRDPYEKHDRYTTRRSKRKSLSDRICAAARMLFAQRSRPVKIACLLAAILLTYFWLGPSDPGHTLPGANIFRSAKDPLTTPKCSESSSPDKPLIQYVLMIDAGSTGSRIHVYRFNNCGQAPELESEVFEQTEKKEGGSGLSSYADDIEAAAKSLDPLLEVAVKNVPAELYSCTPIAVKATAGLRKLGTELSDKILAAVRSRLSTEYPFALVDEAHGGVQVMDGTDEGVYAWITTNYLLGKIGTEEHAETTAAVMDLGGGSAQIVFEPFFKGAGHMRSGDHIYELSFAGATYILYQHSYLGYGLMEARKSLHSHLIQTLHSTHPDSQSWLEQPVENPCISVGLSREVEVELPEGHSLGEKVTVNMTGPVEASPEQCRNMTEKVLKVDADCGKGPCAFDGVYQPDFTKVFSWDDVYLFSYFYDRTYPLGMPEAFRMNDLWDLASRVCMGERRWTAFRSISGAVEELKGRPEHCLDLTYMYTLLAAGYKLPEDRGVRVAKKINGNELGWCLGASLPLLSQESGWSCKVDKVA